LAAWETPLPLESPLGKYWEVVGAAEQWTAEQLTGARAGTWAEREAAVVACMKEQGFDYYPTSYQAFARPMPPGDTLPIPFLPDSRETVETYGYGLLEADDESAAPYGWEEDPMQLKNNEYVDSLSPSAQVAYWQALNGMQPDGQQVLENSCSAKADAQAGPVESIGGQDTAWYMDQFRGMSGATAAMEPVEGEASSGGGVVYQPPADARIAQLNSEWFTCMREAGQLKDAQEAATTTITAAFWSAIRTGADGSVDAGSDNAPLDQRSLIGSPLEIAIALADFDCRAKTDYVNRFAQVWVELEQRYVDQHRAELDNMVATWESIGG
jgi:hypothetical protein